MAAEILELAKYFAEGRDSKPDRQSSSSVSVEGHVDLFGYHAAANGLFFCGWISHPWPEGEHPQGAAAHFEDSDPFEGSLMTFHHREDVHGRGIGFILVLRCFVWVVTTSSGQLQVELSGEQVDHGREVSA